MHFWGRAFQAWQSAYEAAVCSVARAANGGLQGEVKQVQAHLSKVQGIVQTWTFSASQRAVTGVQ